MVKKLPIPRDQKPNKPEIPDKPSQAILAALRDLEAAEKTSGYVVDMHSWFNIDSEENKCAVCLAGAVIARAGQAWRNIRPEDFDKKTEGKLVALDEFRVGSVEQGLYKFYGKSIKMPTCLPDYFDVASYDMDSSAFKKDMRKLAELLASCGY
jgi:hypothetical protein